MSEATNLYAVKRNGKKLPNDFMFQLDSQEVINFEEQLMISSESLRSQIATLKNQQPANQGVTSNWSQFATSSSKHRGTEKNSLEHLFFRAFSVFRGQN